MRYMTPEKLEIIQLVEQLGSFEIRKDKNVIYNHRTTAGIAKGKRS